MLRCHSWYVTSGGQKVSLLEPESLRVEDDARSLWSCRQVAKGEQWAQPWHGLPAQRELLEILGNTSELLDWPRGTSRPRAGPHHLDTILFVISPRHSPA